MGEHECRAPPRILPTDRQTEFHIDWSGAIHYYIRSLAKGPIPFLRITQKSLMDDWQRIRWRSMFYGKECIVLAGFADVVVWISSKYVIKSL